MNSVISWLQEMFLIPSGTQTIIILSIVSGIGLLLGRMRIASISLGVTFVFFVGILFAHFGVQTVESMTSFIQSFGLALFVYALGVEVGPSFFPSLKSKGIGYNLQGIFLLVITYIMVIAIHYSLGISMGNILGVMSGAATNTPVLAAVQSTLQSLHPTEPKLGADAAMATAVTYPFGVVGVILSLALLFRIAPTTSKTEKSEFRAAYIAEFEILTEGLCGHTVKDIVQKTKKHFIISRIWRKDELLLPSSTTQLYKHDHILVLCHQEDAEELEAFFGKRDDQQDWNRPDINWDAIDARLNSKRIIITNPKLNGVKLGTLKLRNKYSLNITRIDRAGVELLASPDLYLQTGDRLVVVGEAGAVSQVEKLMGNSIQTLDKPRLVSFFLGLALGCLLGSIPLFIPGMSIPLKLGLAGGPIVMGILMGAFGARLKVSTFMTNSATQLIKQIGLVLYLAGLGLSTGGHFADTLLNGDGLLWLGLGALITVGPILISGGINIFILKKGYAETAGMLCGSVANPFALDYAVDITESRNCSVAYATVYPVIMFLRIISAQILLILFL
ncbi:MAG: putative transporter [Porphyromonas sp.]|mgnify:CR=1 FL=1|nr:putative transporter [Porphyromonas sp.]RKW47678.1 MAG: putative transporter [Porphyromonas sp.]